ncbi:MAG: peptidylprolyl isomerase, partial [Planctomycetaceae bacterium]
MSHPAARVRTLVAVICLVTGAVAAGRQPGDGRKPTDEVAIVGDTPIFRSELDAVMRRAAGAGQLPGPTDGLQGSGDGAARRQWLEATAIEQLVDARLLRNAVDRERISVARSDVDIRLEQLRKQVAARGMEWQRFLEQTGRDEGAIREQIELEIGLDLMIRPKLTPAVIAAGLERHKRELDGTRLRVSHVVLRPDAARGDEAVAAATARAAAIRREIVQGGTTFDEAARRHSAGPSRVRGGDIGWISRDTPFLDAFGKQAFALAKGDVSKPFVTPFGVHIVQVTAIEPGRIGLEAVRPKLETLIAGELLRETLARLRKSTPVSYSPGVSHFDPATPADGPGPRRVVAGIAPTPSGSGPRARWKPVREHRDQRHHDDARHEQERADLHAGADSGAEGRE